MTNNTEQLREALKVAFTSHTQEFGGVIGAIYCDDKKDARLILEAARKYLEALPVLEEIDKAGEKAANGIFFARHIADDQIHEVMAEDEDGLTYIGAFPELNEREAEFTVTCANLRPKIKQILGDER